VRFGVAGRAAAAPRSAGHGEQEPGLLADGLAAGASLALLDLPASRYPVHRVQLA
jgi:hypothetical protein